MTTEPTISSPICDYSNLLVCAAPTAGPEIREALASIKPRLEIDLIADPLQVLSALQQKYQDIVLLDAASLKAGCIEVVKTIRSRYARDELPILILYDPLAREIRNAAYAAGANECLSHPIDPDEAAIRIRQCAMLSCHCQTSTDTKSLLEAEIKSRTEKLDMLIESGLMMSMEKSRGRLLMHILTEGQKLLNCDGGTMFLITKDKKLRFAERTRDDSLPFEEIALYDPVTGQPNERYASSYTALNNKPIIIDDVYTETRFDWSGTRDFDTRSGYRTVSLLTVPMAPRGGKVIGVLQFFNAKSPLTGEIVSFPADIIDLVEALAAQSAVALDNLQLVQAQKYTTENIIRIMAQALDSKSPHTGHHCVRVPELAIMLAEAACKVTDGPLADFNFKSEDEWFEFRVGAWLHDCGKVTTPENVIDKATKLEAIYNRIHEIRTRFEVLLRDAEIKVLKARLQGLDQTAAEALMAERKNQLHDDFAFIAACNLGKETMSEDDIERIKRISETKWLRHFDDRLGLSREEIALRNEPPQPSLPAEECLLSDKPYHVIPRNEQHEPSPELRIKMDIPQNLYNQGEIYNLTVRKGTLTTEERFKINEHIIETIKMLEQMPFPDSLKRVPEYATTHHEKLDGTGYPRKLDAGKLSIPARIMAIADIFEALTSDERPYKQAYKLSESLKILNEMRLRRHIDADLFELFLTSGTYLRFAEQFLNTDQIDDIDISQFLNLRQKGC